MAVSINELRRVLAERFPTAVPPDHGRDLSVPTGIMALDRVLPNGGLPRGRVTAWAPGGGASAILRGACSELVSGGERAAWVEGGTSLAWSGWEGSLLLRSSDERTALECAEELLRTSGFGLVVLSGVEPSRLAGRRLARAAREGGGALVSLTRSGAGAALRLSSRIRPDGYRWRMGLFGGPAEVESALVRVQADGLGISAWVEFSLPVIQYEVPLSLERGLVDRRGSSP